MYHTAMGFHGFLLHYYRRSAEWKWTSFSESRLCCADHSEISINWETAEAYPSHRFNSWSRLRWTVAFCSQLPGASLCAWNTSFWSTGESCWCPQKIHQLQICRSHSIFHNWIFNVYPSKLSGQKTEKSQMGWKKKTLAQKEKKLCQTFTQKMVWMVPRISSFPDPARHPGCLVGVHLQIRRSWKSRTWNTCFGHM